MWSISRIHSQGCLSLPLLWTRKLIGTKPPFLEVSLETVKRHFTHFGLGGDANVVFDMYESCADIMANLRFLFQSPNSLATSSWENHSLTNLLWVAWKLRPIDRLVAGGHRLHHGAARRAEREQPGRVLKARRLSRHSRRDGAARLCAQRPHARQVARPHRQVPEEAHSARPRASATRHSRARAHAAREPAPRGRHPTREGGGLVLSYVGADREEEGGGQSDQDADGPSATSRTKPTRNLPLELRSTLITNRYLT